MDAPGGYAPSDPEWANHPWWWRFLISAVIFLILAGIFNLIIDPYRIYGVELLEKEELNYYRKKLQLINDLKTPPEALILGSSSEMSYDPDLITELTGLGCFNFAIPGACTENLYSALRVGLKRFPDSIRLVVVGFDPRTVHPTLPLETEARYVSEFSQYFIHNPEGQASQLEKFELLFTIGQLEDSASTLNRAIAVEEGVEKHAFRDDGFAIWSQIELEIRQGKFDLDERIRKRIRRYPEQSLRLSEFTELSTVRKQYWEDFLDLCVENDIKVYAFYHPVHPILMRNLYDLGAQPIFDEFSEYVDSTVRDAGGVYRDFRWIDSFGGDPDEYYDELHPRPANGVALMRKLLSEYQVENKE